MRIIISEFMDKRLLSIENKYVLSTQKILDYVERFYFLYQTNNQIFALSEPAKKSLISQLKEAMTNSQLCESGRYIRFESIIMEFSADKNWINVFLQKQRYLIINELNQEFDANVHTLGLMQLYAHEKNLGLTPLDEISDVYIGHIKECSIKNFFDKHYVEKFTAYEKNVVNNLSEHLLFKLTEF